MAYKENMLGHLMHSLFAWSTCHQIKWFYCKILMSAGNDHFMQALEA
jgi:hypothetical protein